MTFENSYKGRPSDEEDKSGVATILVNRRNFSLQLKSFTDYQTVQKMIDLAFDEGKRCAIQEMRVSLDIAFEKVR